MRVKDRTRRNCPGRCSGCVQAVTGPDGSQGQSSRAAQSSSSSSCARWLECCRLEEGPGADGPASHRGALEPCSPACWIGQKSKRKGKYLLHRTANSLLLQKHSYDISKKNKSLLITSGIKKRLDVSLPNTAEQFAAKALLSMYIWNFDCQSCSFIKDISTTKSLWVSRWIAALCSVSEKRYWNVRIKG